MPSALVTVIRMAGRNAPVSSWTIPVITFGTFVNRGIPARTPASIELNGLTVGSLFGCFEIDGTGFWIRCVF